MKTKGNFWVTVPGVCLLSVMLATTGCVYRQFFHEVDVSITPADEPHLAYLGPVKKVLVTETVAQTKEGPVNLTQAVSDAFAKTGVEVIKPVQFAIGTQVAGQSTAAAMAIPADHVLHVTVNTPVTPLGAGQVLMGNKIQSTIAVRSEMLAILDGGVTKTVWLRNYTAQVAHGMNFDTNAIGAQIMNDIAQDWANHYKALQR